MDAHFTAMQMNVHLPKGKTLKAKDLYDPSKGSNGLEDLTPDEVNRRDQEARKSFGAEAIPVNPARLTRAKQKRQGH